MKIVLATGIFPPDIGGPATYVSNLAREMAKKGLRVTVVTYGSARGSETLPGDIKVVRTGKEGGPLLRWKRYAKALSQEGKDADILYAFSSVSCGIPLAWARLKHPRKVLRLGGDFVWERYTDRGGELGLRKWYETKPWFQGAMNGLLRTFDYLIFSTAFQERLYEQVYIRLPSHSVVENALPSGEPRHHEEHKPFRLLYLGRFVAFKNLPALLHAVKALPLATLSLIGDGPMREPLGALAQELGIADRVIFSPPLHGEDKQKALQEHDLLVIPSHTELSPNAALEARTAGLPVLLTEETGLSTQLTEGMTLRPMRTSRDIIAALEEVMDQYSVFAHKATLPLPKRGWSEVCDEHIALFRSLL
jgi:glycosyltransferase involved in cell wall biosynthesis